MLTIPPPKTAHESVPALVDGVEMVFRYDYTERDQDWRVTVSIEGVVIISGRHLSPGWNPFVRVKSESMPPGAFYFRSLIDPSGGDAFASDDVRLVYFTTAEVAAFTAGAPTPPGVTITGVTP